MWSTLKLSGYNDAASASFDEVQPKSNQFLSPTVESKTDTSTA